MRFSVTRSTSWDEKKKPCTEAVRGELVRVDARTFRSAEEYNKKFGHEGTWESRGTNHRKDGSGIARDVGVEPAWFVEIDALEALMKFQEKYGELVLRPSWVDRTTPTIEIYDGYRE